MVVRTGEERLDSTLSCDVCPPWLNEMISGCVALANRIASWSSACAPRGWTLLRRSSTVSCNCKRAIIAGPQKSLPRQDSPPVGPARPDSAFPPSRLPSCRSSRQIF